MIADDRELQLSPVGEVANAKQARILIDEAKRAEQLLRAVEQLDENLCKLVDHEISVYKAIKEAGLAYKVKGVSARYACIEFSKLTDRGIELLRKECLMEGMTVRGNFERQRRNEREANKVESFISTADVLIDRFKSDGTVDISVVDAKSWDKETAFLLGAAKDRLKDKLLSIGAVGIGDGVYIDPARNKDKVWQALLLRLRSIRSDMMAAARLYEPMAVSITAEQRQFLDQISFNGFCEFADNAVMGGGSL